ncbi:hypothetical protein [Pseudomonas sp. FEN]|uniref:hypothetical protein n=1 Tax=Pseudomonas sp. FEN TaxID=2767468 RepID=UPI00174D4C86|nr:hypothetical protein [Pseudomonas sp. FEN]
MFISAFLSSAATAAVLWLAARFMYVSLGFAQALIVAGLGGGATLLLPEASQYTSWLWILVSTLVYFFGLRIFTGAGHLTLIKVTVVAWILGLVALTVLEKLL